MMWKDEREAREQLLEYGHKLLADNLVQGTWGNLSLRLDEDHMLCTPSGLDYDALTPEDFVVVEISSMSYDGEQKPTSEKGLHAGIYKLRPEVGAVIHTHSKYCSIFAAAEMPMEVEKPELAEKIGNIIRIAKYALPGTKALTKNTLAALGGGTGAILAHHGMVCCGADLEDTYQKCKWMEEAAALYIDGRWGL